MSNFLSTLRDSGEKAEILLSAHQTGEDAYFKHNPTVGEECGECGPLGERLGLQISAILLQKHVPIPSQIFTRWIRDIICKSTR